MTIFEKLIEENKTLREENKTLREENKKIKTTLETLYFIHTTNKKYDETLESKGA